MKILETTRTSNTPLTDREAQAVLNGIVISIMDHGSVRLATGTVESAALIKLMKETS